MIFITIQLNFKSFSIFFSKIKLFVKVELSNPANKSSSLLFLINLAIVTIVEENLQHIFANINRNIALSIDKNILKIKDNFYQTLFFISTYI